jgi:hypothetical protein
MIVPSGVVSGSNSSSKVIRRQRRRPRVKPKALPGRPKRKQRRRVRRANALTDCEKTLARALSMPFDPELKGKVCAPVFPSRPSQKIACTCYLPSVTIGTAGVGFASFDVTPANDLASIYYTDATYAGTGATAFAKVGTGVNAGYWRTPYAAAPFSATDDTRISARVVSAGIRYRYTGKQIDAAGNTVAVQTANHSVLTQALGSYAASGSKRTPVSRSWTTIPVPPLDFDDWDFVLDPASGSPLFPWSRSALSAPFFGVIFNGTAGTTYEVEMIMHVEYNGQSIATSMTRSHIGRPEVVDNTIAAAAQTVTQPDNDRSPQQQILNYFKSDTAPSSQDLFSYMVDLFSGSSKRDWDSSTLTAFSAMSVA